MGLPSYPRLLSFLQFRNSILERICNEPATLRHEQSPIYTTQTLPTALRQPLDLGVHREPYLRFCRG